MKAFAAFEHEGFYGQRNGRSGKNKKNMATIVKSFIGPPRARYEACRC
jgi:hypothetical protein